MKFVEKAIEIFSPQWALERAGYRLGLEQLRNYDAASQNRLNNDWVAATGTAEQIDKFQRDIIRRRARDLERNNDLAEGIVSALERNVVGTGIKPQARIRSKSGKKLDDNLNKTLENLWKVWVKSKNCDVTGQSNFYELQAVALRRMFYDGETIFNKVQNKQQRIPLQLQMLDPDQLGSMDTEYQGNKIQSGVELTAASKPEAYWFYQLDPLGFQTFEPYRIPAPNIVHLFRKSRPYQIRGISELARVMRRIRDIDKYLEADLVAARLAACYAGFVESDTGNNSRPQTDDKGNKLNELTPGIVQYLRPGQKMTFSEPKRNAGTAKEYNELQSRKAAAGVGVSYDIVTRDIKGNFSAARQNLLEDRKTFGPLQEFLINHFCQPIWEEFVTACVLNGLIPSRDFFSDPDRYFECIWITPGWTWIDPLKEVSASKEELRAGITTLAEVCGTQGKDWQEVLEQRAIEKQYAEGLGLTLDTEQTANQGALKFLEKEGADKEDAYEE